jgi:hypothetical protein
LRLIVSGSKNARSALDFVSNVPAFGGAAQHASKLMRS